MLHIILCFVEQFIDIDAAYDIIVLLKSIFIEMLNMKLVFS